jgi:hypothetical protein
MRLFWIIAAFFRRDRHDYLELSTERRQMNMRIFDSTMVLLLAGIIWTGPKLTPQQAADIMRPHQFVPVPTCNDCTGPYFASTGWKPPAPLPPRRLDGTLLTDPPTVYGLPQWRVRPTFRWRR